jgi:hypothetical protein
VYSRVIDVGLSFLTCLTNCLIPLAGVLNSRISPVGSANNPSVPQAIQARYGLLWDQEATMKVALEGRIASSYFQTNPDFAVALSSTRELNIKFSKHALRWKPLLSARALETIQRLVTHET